MKRYLVMCAAALMLAVLSGCAAIRPMPFAQDHERLQDKKTAIYLMTVSMENKLRTGFQPRLNGAQLARKTADGKWQLLGYNVDVGSLYEDKSVPSERSVAVRMDLEPGEYELRSLVASSYAVITNATFIAPTYVPFRVSAQRGVFYMGNVRATLRERKAGDLPAGPVVPIIAQEVSGAAGGSFDVVVSDRQRVDEAMFRAQYPALGTEPIRPALLPPYSRARALQRAAEEQQ
ncbi:MAG: hypothetical protein Q4G71_11510 [Pseudomonadota bacterium]|nr:hypothetical protein [Pseudomonadota bacterium]